MPLAGESSENFKDMYCKEYFELDRWLWAHDEENFKTLSDRCLALRDARILSEDVGTPHQPGDHTVSDINHCRNIARHMTPKARNKGCLKRKIDTNNKLDNCFGWPVLWVDQEAWFFIG